VLVVIVVMVVVMVVVVVMTVVMVVLMVMLVVFTYSQYSLHCIRGKILKIISGRRDGPCTDLNI
jgi:hypothetical protein